jgi:hypothetical protein
MGHVDRAVDLFHVVHADAAGRIIEAGWIACQQQP